MADSHPVTAPAAKVNSPPPIPVADIPTEEVEKKAEAQAQAEKQVEAQEEEQAKEQELSEADQKAKEAAAKQQKLNSAMKVAGAAAGAGIGAGVAAAGAVKSFLNKPLFKTSSSSSKSGFSSASKAVGHPFALILFLAIVGLCYSIYIYNIQYIGICLAIILLFYMSKEFRVEFDTISGLIFFLTLVVHAIFAKYNFVFSTATIVLIVAVYAPILVFNFFLAKDRMQSSTTTLVMILLTLLVYSLPTLISTYYPNENAIAVATYIVFIVPLWTLYTLNQVSQSYEHGYAEGLFWWYKLALALLVVGFVISGVFLAGDFLPKTNFGGGTSTQDSVAKFTTLLKTTWSGLAKRFTINTNALTNPGAYYTGQIDQSDSTKKLPLGVTLEARAQDAIVTNDTPIVVYGKVSAQSFIGTSLLVDPSCLISSKGAPPGVPDPIQIDAIFGTSPQFSCTFPPIQKTGTYTVKVSGTFPFETWVYLPVTFVDEERARSLASQGTDVRKQFNIVAKPTAIYTAGPLMVGMGGADQPILINTQKSPMVPAGMTIGMTLDPGWQKGALQEVSTFEIKVPKPFNLTGCDRPLARDPEQDSKDDQYTSYLFEPPKNTVLTTAKSITCKIGINPSDKDAADTLINSGDKVVRSFIGVVKYRYTITEQASVQVK